MCSHPLSIFLNDGKRRKGGANCLAAPDGEAVTFQARARQKRGGVTQSLALPTSNLKGKALFSKCYAFQRVLSSTEHSLGGDKFQLVV